MRHTINKELQRLTKIILTKKILLIDFLFLFICTWTLITSGASFQKYAFNFINNNDSNIYDSSFNNSIAKFSNLNDFILSSFSLNENFNYIAAIFITLTALYFKSSKQIFFVSIISSTLALCTTDLFFFITSEMTSKSLMECFIANALGSPLIAAYMVFIFHIRYTCISIENINIALKYIVSYLLYTLVILFTLIATYYSISFFYRPTTVSFSTSVSNDISGAYFLTKEQKRSIPNNTDIENNKFSILGNGINLNSTADIISNATEIKTNFNKNDTYRLTLNFLINCLTSGSIPNQSIPLVFDNVKSFSVGISEPVSLIKINDKHGYVKITDELVNMFSIKKTSNGSYVINKKNDGTLYYYPSEEDGEIYLASSGIQYDKGQLAKNNTIQFNINGITKIVNIKTQKPHNNIASEVMACSNININPNNTKQSFTQDNALLYGISIKIKHMGNTGFYSPFPDNDSSKFYLKGNFTDISIKNIKESDLSKYYTNGYLDGFLLYHFDKLSLNSKNIETNKMDNSLVMGDDIYAHISQDASLVLSGKADLFYRNRLRENKTSWELSSDNTVILAAIVTVFFVFSAWVGRLFILTLKKNKEINVF